MKNLKITTILAVLLLLSFSSCKNDEVIQKNKVKKVNLKYALENPGSSERIQDVKTVDVEAELVLEGDKYILKSKHLKEVKAINSETGEEIYGYVYIEEDSEGSDIGLRKPIYRGYYGFDGECFYYGTLIVGDNGGELFIPADTLTQLMGFAPICPGDGQAYV